MGNKGSGSHTLCLTFCNYPKERAVEPVGKGWGWLRASPASSSRVQQGAVTQRGGEVRKPQGLLQASVQREGAHGRSLAGPSKAMHQRGAPLVLPPWQPVGFCRYGGWGDGCQAVNQPVGTSGLGAAREGIHSASADGLSCSKSAVHLWGPLSNWLYFAKLQMQTEIITDV